MNKPTLAYQEIDKSVDAGVVVLHGTLCLPVDASPKQVFLMITGSGEIDRNENSMQLQLNTFNSIAHSLAGVGIASFRFDKRGCSMSGGKFHETGFYNLVDDAETCLNALDNFNEVRHAEIYLLGHGEGTLISSYLSASNVKVRGQILLTPFLENMEIAIERQLQRTLDEVGQLTGIKGIIVRLFIRLSGNQLGKQRKIMKRVKSTTKSTIKLKKTLINAKWLREITAIEPANVYDKVSVPTLSIGGAKDLQCLPADALSVENHVKGPVETHVLSDMTHILRVDKDEPSTFKYKQLSQNPVDPRVCEIIVEWLPK